MIFSDDRIYLANRFVIVFVIGIIYLFFKCNDWFNGNIVLLSIMDNKMVYFYKYNVNGFTVNTEICGRSMALDLAVSAIQV